MSRFLADGIVFDAFLSYHESDKEWVTQELIRHLEDEGIAVCWDDRDFQPGKTIIENKLNALCSSACTLVILTPNYVRDETLWITLNEKCGVDKKDIINELNLIPILLKQCKVPDIFVPLWKLDWTNKAAKGFFWKKLTVTVKNIIEGIHNFRIDSKSKQNHGSAMQGNQAVNEGYWSTSQNSEGLIIQQNSGADNNEFLNENRLENLPEEFEKLPNSEELTDVLDECSETEKNVYSGDRNEERNVEKLDENEMLKNSTVNLDIIESNAEMQSPCSSVQNPKLVSDIVDEDCVSKLMSEENENKFLEKMHPRIISLFVPEDDDLTRQDIEELMFKVEDLHLNNLADDFLKSEITDSKSFSNTLKCNAKSQMKRKKKSNLEKFNSQQEQISVLDFLQEKEIWIRNKFEKCTESNRKRVYRRLLERFDEAICSTVNGEKDSVLLASLPISGLSLDEIRGYYCSCCDQVFHSERALQLHTANCVKDAWMSLLNAM